MNLLLLVVVLVAGALLYSSARCRFCARIATGRRRDGIGLGMFRFTRVCGAHAATPLTVPSSLIVSPRAGAVVSDRAEVSPPKSTDAVSPGFLPWEPIRSETEMRGAVTMAQRIAGARSGWLSDEEKVNIEHAVRAAVREGHVLFADVLDRIQAEAERSAAFNRLRLAVR